MVGDPGEPEGVGPPADSGEEVTLSIPGNVDWLEIGDRSAIDASRRDEVMGDEIFQP